MNEPLTSDRNRGTGLKNCAAVLYERHRFQILTLLFGSLGAWLVWNWAHTVQELVRYYNPLPTADYWRVPYDLFHYKKLGIQIFLRPHNEHRILFPEIIFLLDVFLWHGRLILPLVASFLCYLGTWVILSLAVRRDRAITPAMSTFAILLAGIVIGWKGAAVVLGNPFLLQWTLSTMCVALSFAFLARARGEATDTFLTGTIISAVVATYSSGNCLMLWPLLVGAAVILRLRRKKIIVLIIAAAASVGLYFVGYNAPHKLNLAAFLSHPFYALGFIATYISMPFGDIKSPRFGAYVGIADILVFAILLAFAIRNRMLRSATAIVLFGVYFFVLLTAALTAAGRMDTADVGFSEAKASRYWAIPLINWAVLILLCNWMSARRRWKLAPAFAMNAGFIVLIVLGCAKLRWSLENNGDQFANGQFATLAIENGLRDPGLTRRIFPDPEFVFSLLPSLEDHQLSIYSLKRTKWLGHPASAIAPVRSTSQPGEISYTFPVESGIEVVGWAEPERGGSENIVFLNEKREVVGMGQRLPAGLPADLRSLRTPTPYAWIGFVNLNYSARTVSPFFQSRRGLLPITGTVALPSAIRRATNETGALLTGIQWQMDKTWTVDGIPRGSGAGVLPHGVIYGSWSGSDANTGKITSSAFPVPPGGCLILPILHGSSIEGLAAEIGNADTGQLLVSVPMQNGDVAWEFWKISFDKSSRRLRVTIQDQGSGWGQWLAVAQPSACDSNTR